MDYYVSIGYSAIATGSVNYRHDLDTAICRPNVGISQFYMNDTPILISPDPIINQV